MEALLRLITERPGRVLASFGAVMVVATLLTGLLHFEQNILALLPQDNRAFKLLSHTVTASNGQDKLYILVSADTGKEALISQSKKLIAELSALKIDGKPGFRSVTMLKAEAVSSADFLELLSTYLKNPSPFLTEHDLAELSRFLASPQLLDQEVRRSLALLATPGAPMLTKIVSLDPLNLRRFFIDKLHAMQGAMDFADGPEMLSSDHKALILIAQPGMPGTDKAFAHELMASSHAVFTGYPELKVGLTGGYAIAAQEEALMRGDILNCLLGSVLGIGLLFLFAYRRLTVLLFIIIPLAVGLQLALGFMAITIGQVHMIAVAFAAVVLGLGVDFAIHIYDRYTSERLAGQPPAEATRRAVMRTGSAVLVGGLTTLSAFGVLITTASPVLQQIGWLVSLGLFFCLITILWALPAWLNWLEGRTWTHNTKPFSLLGINHIGAFVKKRPRLCLVLSLVVLLASLPGIQRIHFERKLEALHPEGLEAVQVRQDIHDHFSKGIMPLLVSWQSPSEEAFWQESRRIDKLLSSLPSEDHNGWISLTTLSAGRQLELAHLDRALIDRALTTYGLSLDSFPTLVAFLSALDHHDQTQPSFLSHLLPLHQRFFFEDQGTITGVTWINVLSEEAAVRLEQKMAAHDPTILVVSLDRALGSLMDSAKSGLLKTVILATLLVVVILLIFFRSIKKTLLAMMPTALALITTAGIMGYLGITINLINFIIIPILIGIGLDDGIHLIDRFRETGDIGQTLTTTGRSILLTTLTTCLGFGSLALAKYHVLSSMGMLTIIGVSTCFIYSVITLSALLQLRGNRG
ncbi:MAG: MMPL family transporter [Proteobacteria bacterium]|nr:MMPL family transporter [Pseudomonadota bacterium]MBU1639510.1 MMPL family transporter [Pseudomonadota bacterium]